MKLVIFIISMSLLLFCNFSKSNKQSIQSISNVIELDSSKNHIYSWKEKYSIENKLKNRIATPNNYERIKIDDNSFAAWLRNIPLKKGNSKVYLFNGEEKNNQNAQFAVLDIDVGKKDLQQCADAIMRLRAEYLFSTNKKNDIAFNFTSGDKCKYSDWAKGIRPIIKGNKVSFVKSKTGNNTYKAFKQYMETIFTYCGTYSLEKELKAVTDILSIKIGDVFIQGGFPGHAVIVMDIAINVETKEKIFLLAQSYMPAQDIHILKNYSNNDLNPWFSINFGDYLLTPEWEFNKSTLKRF